MTGQFCYLSPDCLSWRRAGNEENVFEGVVFSSSMIGVPGHSHTEFRRRVRGPVRREGVCAGDAVRIAISAIKER
jgi:hypothetical protein